MTPLRDFPYNLAGRNQRSQDNMRRKGRGILSVLTPGDIILMGVIFILSSLGLYFITLRGERGRICVVEVDGRVVYEIPLSEEREFEVEGAIGKSKIRVKDGAVRITDSPCPLKLCVKTGEIEKTNQVICCLPNRVVVRIEGGRGDVDAVTW